MDPQDGSPGWITRMDPQDGSPGLIPRMDPQDGSPGWIPRMDPQDGSPGWIPRMGPQDGSWPTLLFQITMRGEAPRIGGRSSRAHMHIQVGTARARREHQLINCLCRLI